MPMEVRRLPKGAQRPPREPEEREHEERWRPPSNLPTPPASGGVVYRWLRKYLNGQLDQNNMQKRFSEGWKPVLASEFPEYQPVADPTQSTEYVEVGGLILCRCSEALMDQRKAYYERFTERQMATVDKSMFRFEDKRMPMFSERSTTTTLGRKPVEG